MRQAVCVFMLTAILMIISSNITEACIGARAAAMGHAGVASQMDATVVYWNPAMLPWAEPGISIGVVRPLKYDYLSISGGNIGFLYVDEEWDPYTHFSVGLEIFQNFSIGCSFGIAHSFLDDTWLPYISPAIAWKSNNSNNITFGVLLQTMTNLRPALSFSTTNFLLVAEYYDLLNYYDVRRLRLGVECRYQNLFLRCGSEITSKDVIKNIGFGYNLKDISIDVSYDTFSKWTLSSSYRFNQKLL